MSEFVGRIAFADKGGFFLSQRKGGVFTEVWNVGANCIRRQRRIDNFQGQKQCEETEQ